MELSVENDFDLVLFRLSQHFFDKKSSIMELVMKKYKITGYANLLRTLE